MNELSKPSTFNQRIVGYLIDLACIVVPTVIIFSTITNNYMYKALGGGNLDSERYSFESDSGLFTLQSGVTYLHSHDAAAGTDQSKNGYELYMDELFYYYNDFLPTDDRAVKSLTNSDGGVTTFTSDDFVSYFETKVLSLPAVSTIDDVTDEAKIKQTGDVSYFKYAVTGGQIDIHSAPVLTDEYQAKVDQGDSVTLTSLRDYFFTSSSSYGGLYYVNGYQDIEGSLDNDSTLVRQTYASIRSSNSSMYRWMSYIVVYIPLVMIFMLIIPLSMKNGQTIGKRIMKTAVVGKDGYTAKHSNVFFHYFWLFFIWMFPVWPNLYLGILTFCLINMIDYLVLVASKTQTSLHDKLSGTKVIDLRCSTVFASEQAKVRYYEENPTKAPNAPKLTPSEQAELNRIAMEDSILDLSTMNKNREAAANMTSFDEFEKWSSHKKVNLHKDDDEEEEKDAPLSEKEKKDLDDLAKLEGGALEEDGDETKK